MTRGDSLSVGGKLAPSHAVNFRQWAAGQAWVRLADKVEYVFEQRVLRCLVLLWCQSVSLWSVSLAEEFTAPPPPPFLNAPFSNRPKESLAVRPLRLLERGGHCCEPGDGQCCTVTAMHLAASMNRHVADGLSELCDCIEVMKMMMMMTIIIIMIRVVSIKTCLTY